jgi:CheY-like chemotaxis protein
VKEEPTLDQKLIVGSETILLVDDESIVINVCKEMIEKLGYDVITAKSGKQAVDTFREKSEDIDLIILDMIMPGMDGDQTFDQLREINSSIPILLSSGYSLNSQAKKIMEKGCNGFIQKPFLITQLSEKIQNILDEN